MISEQVGEVDRWRASSITQLGLLLVTALLVLLPRLPALDHFATADEDKWIHRSLAFYSAISSSDFANTYQSEHPGVTTMWAGSIGYWLANLQQDGNTDLKELSILQSGRIVIVFFQAAILAASIALAQPLLGSGAALLAMVLIAFDPFHIAHSRLLHLDGLLASWMFLSTIAWIRYLSEKRRRFLAITGAALAFACLTKSTGFALVPILGALSISRYIFEGYRTRELLTPVTLKSFVYPAIGLGLAGLIFFILIWPAMWVKPVLSLQNILVQTFGYSQSGHENPVYFNGQIYEDGKIGFFSWYYVTSFAWRATPITLIGILLGGIGTASRRGIFENRETRWISSALILFILIFTLLINLSAKKFDRYQLPVFPAMDVLAGLGWIWITGILLPRFVRKKSAFTAVRLGVFFVLAAAHTMLSIRTFPYYLSYYNPMLGGSEIAPNVMMIGWGEGLSEAARYLNDRQNAEDLHVFSWYDDGPFDYFFEGTTSEIPTRPVMTPETVEELFTADYAVLYLHQWQRGIPEPIISQFTDAVPEHSIWINGLEYVRVYDLKDVSRP
jgi:4-amino-4-deoxy-L-arabinose transferase-like glycosyltransferase